MFQSYTWTRENGYAKKRKRIQKNRNQVQSVSRFAENLSKPNDARNSDISKLIDPYSKNMQETVNPNCGETTEIVKLKMLLEKMQEVINHIESLSDEKKIVLKNELSIIELKIRATELFDKIEQHYLLLLDPTRQSKKDEDEEEISEKCLCGYRKAQCCNLRSKFLDTIQHLYVKFPEVKRYFDDIIKTDSKQQSQDVEKNDKLPEILSESFRQLNLQKIPIDIKSEKKLEFKQQKVVKYDEMPESSTTALQRQLQQQSAERNSKKWKKHQQQQKIVKYDEMPESSTTALQRQLQQQSAERNSKKWKKHQPQQTQRVEQNKDMKKSKTNFKQLQQQQHQEPTNKQSNEKEALENSIALILKQQQKTTIKSNENTSQKQQQKTRPKKNKLGNQQYEQQQRTYGGDSKKKRNKSKKENVTEVPSIKKLVKYLNDIAIDYVGDLIKKNLLYFGDINLREYADKLVMAGLGRYVSEKIQINRNNVRHAFIKLSSERNSEERDAIIASVAGRNNALHGDRVLAFVYNNKCKLLTKKEADETDECLEQELDEIAKYCPKAFVVEIIEADSSREIVGIINLDKTKWLYKTSCYPFLYLKPMDYRYPLIFIPKESVPLTEDYSIEGLYSAKIVYIDDYGNYVGQIVEYLGNPTSTPDALNAIRKKNGLGPMKGFSESVNDTVKENLEAIVQQDGRVDLTQSCIFTIDPSTARDLDDALSIEEKEPGIFEVGVHISDVSYFLQEFSDLDNIVKERCTSVYLVNEVIHMLPDILCQYCSLLPNENKYTFSVFWNLTSKGEIIGEPRFTRSLIRSCVQLAYENAQSIIDADQDAEKKLNAKDFPQIYNGFHLSDIEKRVLNLHKLALILREKRYDAGAISIDNPHLRFQFNTFYPFQPIAYEVETRQSANFMIEEFMLLANQTVASFIYKSFPDIAILRSHEPPLMRSMREIAETLSKYGININYNSSKELQQSMKDICLKSENPVAINALLSAVLMKPMARAKYFCSYGKLASDLCHYALSIPIYTHFTSPIRRYPDVLVHRLLAACLNYTNPPKRTKEELEDITQQCNLQRVNAKNAEDESVFQCLKMFVQHIGCHAMLAVIFQITAHSMVVVVIKTGHTMDISYRKQQVQIDIRDVPNAIYITNKNSKSKPTRLTVASTVLIKLIVENNQLVGLLES